MGMDFLSAGLWRKTGTSPDFQAGLAAAHALTRAELSELADLTNCDEADPVGWVTTLKEHAEDGSRVLAIVQSPDGWEFWFTGGDSWGDSPNELYDAFMGLAQSSKICAALGFQDEPRPPGGDWTETGDDGQITVHVPADYEGETTWCTTCGWPAPVRDFPHETPLAECASCFVGRIANRLVTVREAQQLLAEIRDWAKP